MFVNVELWCGSMYAGCRTGLHQQCAHAVTMMQQSSGGIHVTTLMSNIYAPPDLKQLSLLLHLTLAN